MSSLSNRNIWIHIIWDNNDEENPFSDVLMRKKISSLLYDYCKEKKITMAANYVNVDQVHALVMLPANKSVIDIVHLFKKFSSRWISEILNYKFSWAEGYSAFSVSSYNIGNLVGYFKNMSKNHQKKDLEMKYGELLHNFSLN